MKSNFCFLILLIGTLLVSGCTQKRYGYIPRVKTKHQTAVVDKPITDTSSITIQKESALKLIVHTVATMDETITPTKPIDKKLAPKVLALADDTTKTEKTKLPPTLVKKETKQDPPVKPSTPKDDRGNLWMFNFLVTMAIIGSIILLPVMFEVVFWYEVYYGFFHVVLGLLFRAMAKRMYESQIKEGSFFTRNFKNENGELTDTGFYMVVLAAFLLLLVIANFIFSIILLAGEFWLDDLIFSLMLVFSAGAILLAWNSFIFYLIKIIDDVT